MRSTEPIEVPPYLCTMSAIVVLNRRKSRAGAPFDAPRNARLHMFHVLHQKPLDENTSKPWIGAIDDLSVTTKRGSRTRKVGSRAKCNSGS